MAFDKILEAVRNSLEQNLKAARAGTIADASRPISLNGTGDIPFDFQLDSSGKCHYQTSQYGAGVTVNCTAVITSPNATFSVTVQSSDGGGGHWDNVQPNQQLNCKINTSFWHSTTITVDITSNAPNQAGHANIHYTY